MNNANIEKIASQLAQQAVSNKQAGYVKQAAGSWGDFWNSDAGRYAMGGLGGAGAGALLGAMQPRRKGRNALYYGAMGGIGGLGLASLANNTKPIEGAGAGPAAAGAGPAAAAGAGPAAAGGGEQEPFNPFVWAGKKMDSGQKKLDDWHAQFEKDIGPANDYGTRASTYANPFNLVRTFGDAAKEAPFVINNTISGAKNLGHSAADLYRATGRVVNDNVVSPVIDQPPGYYFPRSANEFGRRAMGTSNQKSLARDLGENVFYPGAKAMYNWWNRAN